MLTNLLGMLEEKDPGCALGVDCSNNTAELTSQGSYFYAQAVEPGHNCPYCCFQNQTLLAAMWGFGNYIQRCWFHSHALPARATPARWIPGRPPLFPPNSILDSSLVQTHQMEDIKSPLEPQLRESLGMVIFSFPISAG